MVVVGGVRKDSLKEAVKPGRREAGRAASTGCAYFMAATYHKSLSLMGGRRGGGWRVGGWGGGLGSDDFKEITCRTRPTYARPC